MRAGSDAEIVAAELFELGASGVEERATDDPGQVRLVCWIALAEADTFVCRMQACVGTRARIAAPVAEPEVDWSARWRDGLDAIEISPRLTVRPPFVPSRVSHDGVEIVIDPGQAFGTGGHASTRLALALVDLLAPSLAPGARVLDVGTGSGVLALAALALAPASVRAIGFDLDALAAPAARENAVRSALAGRLRVFSGPIDAVGGAPYALVLANLLKRELLPIVDAIAARTAPDGTLIVSGLLMQDLPAVESALARHGLRRGRVVTEDDLDGESWVGVAFARDPRARVASGGMRDSCAPLVEKRVQRGVEPAQR